MPPNFEILIGLEFLFYGPAKVRVRARVRVRLELGVMVVRMVQNIFCELIKNEINWETLHDLAIRVVQPLPPSPLWISFRGNIIFTIF